MTTAQPTPEHEAARFQRGVALERRGELRAALGEFVALLAQNPAHLPAARHASGLFLGLGEREAAARCLFRVAEAHGVDPVDAALCRARGYGLIERPVAAARAAREVLVLAPGHAEAWRLLGTALAVGGAREAARLAWRRAVSLDPDDASAMLDLVRAGRITEADRTLVETLAARLRRDGLSPRQRMTLGFALGKALDDLGDPAAAIAAFDAANDIRARLVPFDPAGFAADVRRIIDGFPDRLAAPGGGRAVFILGLPRSGTTLVEQIVSSHPLVAAGGEMAFWGKAGTGWAAGQKLDVAVLRQAYETALAQVSADAARVTDKNPFNFAWLGLICQVLPDATIIHCRRDARDIGLSAYMTLFSSGNGWAARREHLVAMIEGYRSLMAHWRSLLPAGQMLEIDYETVVAEPEATARRLVAHCGLDWDAACLAPELNRRPVHTASLFQAREPVHAGSVGKWRRYAPWLGALAAAEPDSSR